ncbi:ABC transporter permease [Nocardia bovistercoris]|uniref:Transport permease protein n=1 Tax=Nocardia bovistercoris TaxID=2785916 RepID=A0A931I5W3_9NOCA|nr:ABC transporter permease [Nocardia bovistercoris]MBH0775134.1 ABC transporter permease [Nocardia bovistercoris]
MIAAVVADSSVMLRRCVRHTLRSRDTLIISVLMPIFVMLLFTYVFGGAIDVGGSYLDYVVPGIMMLCTGFGSSITATAVSTDMTRGSIDRFRTLPMFRQAVLVGHVVEGVLRNLAAIAIAVAVAVALGFRPHARIWQWLGAAAVITLFVAAISWISVALGLLAQNPEAAGGLTYAIMFVLYISSAFVPTSTMPGWLRGFAEHQPATPVIDTVRELLGGSGAGGSATAAVLWCLALGSAGAAWSTLIFGRLSHR